MDPTLAQNKETVRRLYEDCINRGDLKALPNLIATDFEGPQGERGPDGYAATVKRLRAGVPDIHFTLEDLVADGDRVVVRWRWQGTHTGTMRGFAPTQRPINTTGIAIYELRDHAIVRAWLETDRLGVLQQIGAVPAELGRRPQPSEH